ncbi:hypothetical protein EWM64_g6460 [Hericium alpestre]|uniref:IPT/TIG domain-containing protein n=1 Tax=Hericium alpestre TaxID=135208 RepID=A0A4Y9ZUN4_9AGAM|nr:hypothetical protein EWM64_g6460 [Hericium alpestre]
MSSSPATATGSRSPSPVTPMTPESSDGLDALALSPDANVSSWYSLPSSKPSTEATTFWDEDSRQLLDVSKEDDTNILSLDDLIQDYAYEDSSPSAVTSTTSSSEPSCTEIVESKSLLTVPAVTFVETVSVSDMQPRVAVSHTKPIPPPTSQPRKRPSSAASQTVVYPPKECCHNLPIMVPSIPEGGTKSRVETQVRVTVDLAHASSSTSEAQYDRVGSWKWLKLPKGTSTKKRTRKEGKIDPDLEDILYLNAEVTCASSPHMRAVCCSSCQTREAKRVARKLAMRVRPHRSDSDSPESGPGAGTSEGSFNIVQFNCPEVLDFSTGSVALPLRITCYCRHHREKVGFLVHFTMADHTGRVVGSGTTRPIMITDDHKSSGANKQAVAPGMTPGLDMDWSRVVIQGNVSEKPTSGKRKHANVNEFSEQIQTKKRAKGSAGSLAAPKKLSRQDSTESVSPSTLSSALPTRTTTPASQFAVSGSPSQFNGTAPSTPPISDNFIIQSPETFQLTPSTPVATAGNGDAVILESRAAIPPPPQQDQETGATVSPPQSAGSPSFLPPAPPSPASLPISHVQSVQAPISMHSIPFMFFNANPSPPLNPLPQPKIHRLIPSSGPTYGGIEVTVLGSNFHLGIQLNCVFGDVLASSTQRWSDNTLVCILPPHLTSGVVPVYFNGIQKEEDGTPPVIFTYTDESDRTLMELALQVVGLKMTGKLEDAKSVAMRIVGPPGDDSQGSSDSGSGMSIGSSALSYNLRHLLRRSDSGEPLEKMTLELLSLLDAPLDLPSKMPWTEALSRQARSGQTLLHIATFLKYSRIVHFLVQHKIDIDARDRNGYTALHVAALIGSKDCAAILIAGGADLEIVEAKGKTAQELASFDLDDLPSVFANEDDVDEEESRWGDAEESEDEPIVRSQLSRRVRIRRRSMETPASSSSEDTPAEKGFPTDEKRKDDRPVGVDEKQAASFMNTLQRTLALVQPTQGIMPHFPIPHLPGMPAVPWGALPQIPMVFPVDVPWPAFLGDKRHEQLQPPTKGLDQEQPKGALRGLWTPQEWRAFWEKWMMQATPTRDDDEPPPKYTPRANETPSSGQPAGELQEEEDAPVAGPSNATTPERLVSRRPNYDAEPLPDQEVNAYAYRPTHQQARQMPQKEDRMLVLFWIPILFIALVWAFVHGIRIAFHSLRYCGVPRPWSERHGGIPGHDTVAMFLKAVHRTADSIAAPLGGNFTMQDSGMHALAEGAVSMKYGAAVDAGGFVPFVALQDGASDDPAPIWCLLGRLGWFLFCACVLI